MFSFRQEEQQSCTTSGPTNNLNNIRVDSAHPHPADEKSMFAGSVSSQLDLDDDVDTDDCKWMDDGVFDSLVEGQLRFNIFGELVDQTIYEGYIKPPLCDGDWVFGTREYQEAIYKGLHKFKQLVDDGRAKYYDFTDEGRTQLKRELCKAVVGIYRDCGVLPPFKRFKADYPKMVDPRVLEAAHVYGIGSILVETIHLFGNEPCKASRWGTAIYATLSLFGSYGIDLAISCKTSTPDHPFITDSAGHTRMRAGSSLLSGVAALSSAMTSAMATNLVAEGLCAYVLPEDNKVLAAAFAPCFVAGGLTVATFAGKYAYELNKRTTGQVSQVCGGVKKLASSVCRLFSRNNNPTAQTPLLQSENKPGLNS